MYFPLCLIVGLIWLWLVIGTFYGWRKRAYSGLLVFGSLGVWTLAAIVVLLWVGPYGTTVYDALLQPG